LAHASKLKTSTIVTAIHDNQLRNFISALPLRFLDTGLIGVELSLR
jgi:hypothetical protein